MDYGEAEIKGKLKQEIFFSSYICHPSMANNELSGPVINTALINYINGLKNRKYSYRFVFVPETIGSIAYINKNLKKLKENMIAGFVINCAGDERDYSYVQTPQKDTLADEIMESSLIGLKKAPYMILKIDHLMRDNTVHQELNYQFVVFQGVKQVVKLTLNITLVLMIFL